MATPEVAESLDSGGLEGPEAPESADESGGGGVESAVEATEDVVDDQGGGAEEPTVAEADLSEDDFADGDGLFSGVEDADESDGDDADSSSDGDDSDDQDDDVLDGLDARGEALEESINEGVARLAVVNIEDDDEQDALETEFAETFEAFRFGYFGAAAVEEYVLVDEDDEIDPLWGFLGAAMMCSAMVVWMRPDGEELVEKTKETVGNIIGGDDL